MSKKYLKEKHKKEEQERGPITCNIYWIMSELIIKYNDKILQVLVKILN